MDDDKGTIYRTASGLVKEGHKSMSDLEAEEVKNHPPQTKHQLLAWLRWIYYRQKLKGIHRTIAKQAFMAGWQAHADYIQEE